ncbi:MAG: L-threonylcarbamoyladenylate synthase [bacterium]
MKVIEVNEENINEAVKEAIKVFESSGVVVCPTDTIYGLLAVATDQKAVEKVFKIKKRSLSNPLPVFVESLKEAKRIAKINQKQERFLGRYWPGKITAILKRKRAIKIYGVAEDTIGLRVPNHKLVSLLLRKSGHCLTGTSVNISGAPSLVSIPKIINQFNRRKYRPDLILDAGRIKKSKPSTIVNLVGEDNLEILRKGDVIPQ